MNFATFWCYPKMCIPMSLQLFIRQDSSKVLSCFGKQSFQFFILSIFTSREGFSRRLDNLRLKFIGVILRHIIGQTLFLFLRHPEVLRKPIRLIINLCTMFLCSNSKKCLRLSSELHINSPRNVLSSVRFIRYGLNSIWVV